MPVIRLVPSVLYNAAGTSYLTVSNQNNAFTNTDSTTYATVNNINASTSSRYIYLRGFNFDDIPAGARINSFAIKLKASESGGSTSSSYRPTLCDGTTTYSNTYCDAITTSAAVKTFTFSQDFDTFRDAGDDFGIRINCRRNSRNTAASFNIYGAEIEVNYTLPVSATVTSSLSGNGTIDPSGTSQVYEGDEYTLTITPTNKSDAVTAKKDGVDITDQLVAHGSETSAECVLGSYSLVSGGFNGSGASYFQGIVGHGVDASETTSNYYSSSSSTNAVFRYGMGFSLPANANITRVYCEVNGHAESTSQSNEYMCVQLKSGSTELSEQINFKNIGTSNTTVTLEADTLPTVAQIADMVLECTLGYYGGAINGATCHVEYDISSGSGVDHYTLTFTVTGDAAIAVVIGGSAVSDKLYEKVNGSWKEVQKAYKKVNGAWIEQTDLKTVFQAGINYKKGN